MVKWIIAAILPIPAAEIAIFIAVVAFDGLLGGPIGERSDAVFDGYRRANGSAPTGRREAPPDDRLRGARSIVDLAPGEWRQAPDGDPWNTTDERD